MNRQRAFTLIELLVVIGILVVLIAILLPSLSKARKAARTAVCLTNLRAIAQNMQLYFTETGTRRLGYRASNYNVNGASGFAENAWDCLFLGHGQTPNEYFLTDYRSAANKIRWCPETQFGPTSYAGMGTAHIR